MERQLYVLDTNIILSNPKLENYAGKTVYIPIAVMKELDSQKTREGEVGFNSRLFHRNLKSVKPEEFEEDYYILNEVIILNPTEELEAIDCDINKIAIADDFFVHSCYLKNKSAVLHTSDFSCFNLVRLADRNAEYINPKRAMSKDMDYLYKEVYVDSYVLSDLSRFKDFDAYNCMDYLLLINNCNPNNKRLVKIRNRKLIPVEKKVAYSVEPRNIGQTILLDALLDQDVKTIILSAKQGCGKSFLSLAGALEQVVNSSTYARLLLGKSQAPLLKSEQIGYLKGDIDQKLSYAMASYFTNLEALNNGAYNFEKDGKIIRFDGAKIFEELKSRGIADYLPLDSILGASFVNTFVIVDEAQSLDIKAIRSVLTRITDSSKLVLCGDVKQSTSCMMSVDSSGLYIANKYLRNVQGVQVITLEEIERGEACKGIAEALDEIDF